MKHLVGVIITSYGEPTKLSRAIRSALFQTYKNIEIIVVDDNEVESSYRKQTEFIMTQFASNPNVHYLKHEKNLNGASARNTGMHFAHGDYIAFLDNDDFFLPDRIEKCVIRINEKKCDAVISDVLLIDGELIYEVAKPIEKKNFQKELLLNSGILGTGSNLFFSRQAVEGTGDFDTSFIRYQDVEYMLRFFDKYYITNIPEVLVVKDTNGRSFPSYNKMVMANDLFMKKFDYLIKRLSAEDKTAFYDGYFTLLLNTAINDSNEENLKKAVEDISKIRALSKKEYIKVKSHKIVLLKKLLLKTLKSNKLINRILNSIKLIKLNSKKKSILNQIGKKKYNIIMSIISK